MSSSSQSGGIFLVIKAMGILVRQFNIAWEPRGLMASALVFGSSGSGSSPGRGHCVVFLGKTIYSHSASLHPGV